ncbi:hypothetical protein LCGC14_0824730, partial [marine sediment metagenome]
MPKENCLKGRTFKGEGLSGLACNLQSGLVQQ